jgi:hypothetical protein
MVFFVELFERFVLSASPLKQANPGLKGYPDQYGEVAVLHIVKFADSVAPIRTAVSTKDVLRWKSCPFRTPIDSKTRKFIVSGAIRYTILLVGSVEWRLCSRFVTFRQFSASHGATS